MKKTLIIAAAMALSLSGLTTQAGFFISWGPGSASFSLDPGTFAPLLPNVGDEALVQLMFSNDNSIDSTVFNDGAGNLSTDGDDTVLASHTHVNTGAGGSPFGSWTAQIYGTNPSLGAETPYLGPNVYVRIFATGTADAGDLYLTSPLAAANDVQDPAIGNALPQTINAFPAGFYDMTAGETVQVIPEPMSFAMLLLGAVTIMVRHRRRG